MWMWWPECEFECEFECECEPECEFECEPECECEFESDELNVNVNTWMWMWMWRPECECDELNVNCMNLNEFQWSSRCCREKNYFVKKAKVVNKIFNLGTLFCKICVDYFTNS